MHGQTQWVSMRTEVKHRRELQSGCFVIDQSGLAMTANGSTRWAQVIGQHDESCALSLFYLEASPGESKAIELNNREAVLYLQDGRCTLSICGRKFDVNAGSGVHVRAAEQFSFINDSGVVSKWLISICPQAAGLNFVDGSVARFNDQFPQRSVPGAEQQLRASEDRFYKLLVGPAIGSEAVTQFIGRIPPSRAPEHFHLYEEAICILSGHGRVWTGDLYAKIRPGSMIFLPRKQPHCLECLDEDGMELVGVFYPAGSPAINYKTA